MAGQVYAVNTLGGNWTVPYLTDNLRHAAQPYFFFRQFLDVHEAIGKKRGDTFHWDLAGNVVTQGGTLTETSTIPETEFNTQQGTATVGEYGNSVPFTFKLDAMGQFELPSTVEMRLRDDMTKVLESAAGAKFTAGDIVGVCVTTGSFAITTNGTATETATADLTTYNVKQAVDFFKKANTPKYDGRNYVLIGSVQLLRGLRDDTGTGGWVNISQYTDSHVANLFSGEIGEYYNVRFVEETGYLSNIVGNSTAHGQGVLFGADNIIEAVAEPEHIRVKNSQDYGRDLGLAWYAILGFERVWDYSRDGEEHVMFITSA